MILFTIFKLFKRIMYFKKTMVVLVLMITSSQCDRTSNLALFWNLYDAVIQGTRILSDVAEGVGSVTKAINAIDDIFDTAAMERFRSGGSDKKATELSPVDPVETTKGKDQKLEKEVAVPDPVAITQSPPVENSVPAFTGCGALGFHIRGENLPVDQLMQCCSMHDTCYGSACNSNKRDCDSKLRDCLFSICDKKNNLGKASQNNCRSAAKLLFSGTMALSFQQYSDTQSRKQCSSNSTKQQKTKKKYG